MTGKSGTRARTSVAHCKNADLGGSGSARFYLKSHLLLNII